MLNSRYLVRTILVAMLAISIREASSQVSVSHSSIANLLMHKNDICLDSNVMVQEQSWCVAKRNAPEAKLAQFIREVCSASLGSLALDCSKIAEGEACFEPNTTRDHASYVLNRYYKLRGECKPDLGILVKKNPCMYY